MSTISLDCGASSDGSCALREIDPTEVGQAEYGEAFAPSLGEFIERAVTVLESAE
jgi:hypothetical protein